MIINEIFVPPRRLKMLNQEQIDYYVDIFNGVKQLYQSVYSYEDRRDRDTVYVDKIFLDFDVQDEGFFENTRIVAKYLHDNNIKFYIRFSGRGFHIFILLAEDWLKDPKGSIKRYVKNLHEITNTSSDSAVVGDISRVARIVNTINLKSNRYCISITYEMLMNMEYEDIYELAIHPGVNYDYINGEKLLDISEFDKEITFDHRKNIDVVRDVKISHDIPPCVRKMMTDPTLGYNGRFYVIVCLRELGYTKDEIFTLLCGFLSDEKFYHCIDDEKALEHLVDDETQMFASCKTLYEDGWCVDEECDGHNIYY